MKNSICSKIIAINLIIIIILMNFSFLGTSNVMATAEEGEFSYTECPYNIEFTQIAAGASHTLAIDNNGYLWSWKGTHYNNSTLGRGKNGKRTPAKVSNKKFSKISASRYTSFAIDEEGFLYGCGYNKYGQLGDGTTEDNYTLITIKPELYFVDVSASEHATVAIDENGDIWLWGGLYHTSGWLTVYEPCNITENVNVAFKKVSITGYGIIAIDEYGNLWSYGYDYKGILGNNSSKSDFSLSELQQITENTIFTNIDSGETFTIALDNNGYLYSWGYGEALGKGSITEINTPTLITNKKSFKEIYAEENSCIAIDLDGYVWTWGTNEYGQLGTNSTDTKTNIQKIELEMKCKKVAISEGHSLLLTTEGEIYGYGRNDNLLGYSDSTATIKDTQIKQVTKLSAKYTVTFKNGDEVLSSQTIAHGEGAQEPTAPTKEGYTFAGWDKDFSNVTSDLTVNAKWTQNKYTVTFKNGDEVVNTQEVVHGGAATAPANPTKTGHTFKGWDKTFTNVTSNLTVNATWEANVYKVTLETNGGAIASGAELTSYTYGIGATLPTPTKVGYIFVGWYTNEELTGDSVAQISATDVGDKEYFAKWEAGEGIVYKVEHYKQNLATNTYEKVETDELTGKTGLNVVATPKTYEGYTENKTHQDRVATGEIAADGSLVLKLYYDVNQYTVTFISDGKTLSTQNIKHGQGAVAPTAPTKVGYTFAGWDKDFSNVTSNLTVNAKWTQNKYTVTFKNGNEVVNTQEVVHGGAATAPTAPTKEGYIFAGWDKDFSNVTSDLTVNAKWTQNKYTVTFKNGDEVVNTQEVVHGGAATAPANPTKTGHTFKGWDKTFTNVTNNLTVNATWEANVYKVTLETNGGAIASGAELTSYTYGIGATLPTPTKTGYTFAGWYKTEDLTGEAIHTIGTFATGDKEYFAKWEAGEGIVYKVEHYKQNLATNTYEKVATDELTGKTGLNVVATPKTYEGYTENKTHQDRVATGEIAADGSLVLKLYYDVNQYTVTFKDGDTVLKTQTVAYGSSATEPETPTKEGYTFAGWDKDFSNVTSDLTVNAKWTQNKYTVTFKNGDEVVNTQEVVHGGAATAPTAPTKEGHTFAGWDKDFSNVTSDLTVNANWNANTYNVTLNANGGTIPEGQNVTSYTYGIGATLPTPTKTGYTFAGWYKTEDLTGEAINTIGTLATGDKEYFAKWEAGEGIVYKVEHYKQNIATNTYEKVATDELTGKTGLNVVATPKTYEEFHENTSYQDRVATGEIAADGSLVLKLYYDINHYTVIFKDGDQVVKEETVAHGGNSTPPTITKPGYILSWDKGTDNITGDTTFTAVWTKDPNYVDPNANDGKEEKPSFLPQTGENYIVVGMILVVMSVAVLIYLKYRKISNM